MEISEENLWKKKKMERFPEAHPEGSGLEEKKHKKVPDPSPLAEATCKVKMLVAKEGNPPPAENCLLERQSKGGRPPNFLFGPNPGP